jgi:hypothetical protein
MNSSVPNPVAKWDRMSLKFWPKHNCHYKCWQCYMWCGNMAFNSTTTPDWTFSTQCQPATSLLSPQAWIARCTECNKLRKKLLPHKVTVLFRVKEQRNILHEISKLKSNWIGHILHRNCLLRQVIEGNIIAGIEVTGRWGRRQETNG